MTAFQSLPRVHKGAIMAIDPFNPVASMVVFQYNPERVSRTLQPQISRGEDGDKSEPLRLRGAPVETINLDIEIDAADQLERGDFFATDMGIYPQLSALEMLVYPKSALVIANTALLAVGTIEIIAPVAPLTVLVLGTKRVLPVKLTNFSITEEAHDTNLNPIRAKVTLGLRVLSYNDLQVTNPGYYLFMAHQIVKETMAAMGSLNSLSSSVSSNVNLL
jgi:hypothetical protein